MPPPPQPMKKSPWDAYREAHHIDGYVEAGHLYKPDFPGRTASRTHVVFKPGEEHLCREDQMGRLVCDYRPINRITEPMAFMMQHAWEMATWMASKLWKSLMDMLSGFNHVATAARAAELLAVQISRGVYCPASMPFGGKNAPAVMQTMVTECFEALIAADLFRAS